MARSGAYSTRYSDKHHVQSSLLTVELRGIEAWLSACPCRSHKSREHAISLLSIMDTVWLWTTSYLCGDTAILRQYQVRMLYKMING